MNRHQREDYADGDTNHKKEANYQPNDGGDTLRSFFHDLFAGSWLQNIVCSIAIGLILLLVAYFLNRSLRALMYGAGAGLTIVFWILWLTFMARVCPTPGDTQVRDGQDNNNGGTLNPPTPTPTPSANISISSQNQSGGFTGVNSGTVNLGPPEWHLSPGQLQTLKERLSSSPKGKVDINVIANDSAAWKFAALLRALLDDAGYDTGAEMHAIAKLGGPPATGITFFVKQAANPPHEAPLLTALEAIHLPITRKSGGFPDDAVYMIVGPPPEP